MALQAPTRLQSSQFLQPNRPLALSGNDAGLRHPSDRFALKSPFFSPFLHLFLPPLVSAPPKFSMRVASKKSYICRDCGYSYNDRTPFEKQHDIYFCPDFRMWLALFFSTLVQVMNLLELLLLSLARIIPVCIVTNFKLLVIFFNLVQLIKKLLSVI